MCLLKTAKHLVQTSDTRTPPRKLQSNFNLTPILQMPLCICSVTLYLRLELAYTSPKRSETVLGSPLVDSFIELSFFPWLPLTSVFGMVLARRWQRKGDGQVPLMESLGMLLFHSQSWNPMAYWKSNNKNCPSNPGSHPKDLNLSLSRMSGKHNSSKWGLISMTRIAVDLECDRGSRNDHNNPLIGAFASASPLHPLCRD